MVRRILFPLAYLLFAVPLGDFLVGPLQDVTAVFTVWALQLTGIPVYLEGRFFYIPTGAFEVAEACSGIRYLIASLALGRISEPALEVVIEGVKTTIPFHMTMMNDPDFLSGRSSGSVGRFRRIGNWQTKWPRSSGGLLIMISRSWC